MRKPLEQKPPLAAWATLARSEAGMSVEEVADALRVRGHAVTEATIRGIEGGSKGGSDRLLRLLAEVYGKAAPEPLGATETPDPVAAAIDRQTAALIRAIEAQGEMMVRTIEAEGEANAQAREAFGEALAVALGRLATILEGRPGGSADLRQVRRGA